MKKYVEGNLMQLFIILLQAKYCCKLKCHIDHNHYLLHKIITSYMGKSVVWSYLSEIREAIVYAVIADETADVSHKEQLCVFIRWVGNNFKIDETPIELINVTKTDGKPLLPQSKTVQ